MRVALHATIGDRCGIAAYSRGLAEALRGLVELEVVPVEPGRHEPHRYSEMAEQLDRADVVHIQHEHSFWGGVLPGRSRWRSLRNALTRPVVVTAHTTYTFAEMLRVPYEIRPAHRLAKLLLSRHPRYRRDVESLPFLRDPVIVHTEEGRQTLIRRGARPERVHTIAAGIAPAAPAPTGGRAFRERHGLQRARTVTVFGYATMFKGYELVMEALPSLPDDVVLVVAGGSRTTDEAPYLAGLLEHARRAGLADRVVVTGYLPEAEVADAMAAADVVAVPHLQATGSYSVTVPLAHGRPILAADHACFREIAANEACIELFPHGSAQALGDRLTALLGDDTRRAELSTRAAAYARERSWDAVARRTMEVYRQALGEAGGPAT